MFKIIGYLTEEENNKAVEAGYQFAAKGDLAGDLNGYYGGTPFPHITYNVYLFETLDEAVEYIRTHDNMERGIPFQLNHIKTREEYEREEAEKKAKKLAKEAKKAAAKNMTVEEYNEWRKKYQKAQRYEREAKKLRAEIERMMEEIAYKEARAKEIRKEIGEG